MILPPGKNYMKRFFAATPFNIEDLVEWVNYEELARLQCIILEKLPSHKVFWYGTPTLFATVTLSMKTETPTWRGLTQA